MSIHLFLFFNTMIFIQLIIIKANCKSLMEKDQLLTFDLPPKGFGKYCVTVRYLEKCSPSILDKENFNSYEIIAKKHNETYEEITGFISLPKTYKAARGKFTPMIQRNGVLKPTFNRTATNPCTDLLMSIPLTIVFKTNEACIFRKGNYTINNINPDKWFHVAFGENFMYERVHSIVEYFSNSGGVFCLYAVIDIIPIPKFKRIRKH